MFIKNDEGKTVIKLKPYKCSSTAFDDEYLESLSGVQRLVSNGTIELVKNRAEAVVNEPVAKDFGQKYKIGTRAYLGKTNLDIIIKSYDPNNHTYRVSLLKTGAILSADEKSISLTKHKGDIINVGIDEQGDLIDVNKVNDNSLPQEPEQVQIVRTEDQSVNSAKNAKDIINGVDRIAEEISSQQVQIVNKSDVEEKPTQDEETFIIKSSKDVFAKEMTSSELIENTSKAINNSLAEVIQSTEVVKPESVEEQVDMSKCSPEELEYITDFMSKDTRVRKVTINRLKDIEKLNIIKNYADEVSKKAAAIRLKKLNA